MVSTELQSILKQCWIDILDGQRGDLFLSPCSGRFLFYYVALLSYLELWFDSFFRGCHWVVDLHVIVGVARCLW